MKTPQLSALVVGLLMAVIAASSCAGPDDEHRLATLLDEFLAGATRGDVATHEAFWADELVYTSSGGVRTDKTAIVAGMRAAGAARPDEPAVTYTAEDVDIRVYGDAAVVAFKLVGTPADATQPVSYYFNTGTFIKRGGRWQAVAWQATHAAPEEPANDD